MHGVRIGKKAGIASAVVAAVGLFAAVAFGSAGVGFLPATIVTANVPGKIHAKGDGIKLWTQGPVDVRVQRIDIAPGGLSGWHHHPGIVIVSVATGAVTFQLADCSTATYGPGLPAGSAFIESGSEPGQASSTLGATVYATYVAPTVIPPAFRTEDDAQPQPCVPPKHHRPNSGTASGNHGRR